MNQNKFGLIGKNISYSFSKKYFENKFEELGLKNHSYNLFDITEIQKVTDIFKLENLKGLNVTIPYKELILQYLDDLNEEAQEIGAVNCISIKNGIKKGFNTDVFGFEKSLLTQPKSLKYPALILGNGGAAKAVKFIPEKRNSTLKISIKKLLKNIKSSYNVLL